MKTIRVTCAHDCPCMCSLLAQVDNGKLVKISGDPEQPFTDGFACAKVNRDAEIVHSPLRVKTPLRRTGTERLWPVRSDHLDRGARRDRDALEGNHRQGRSAGAPRLRLQLAPRPDQPPHAERLLPRARHQPADGRNGLRHLRRCRLGDDARARRLHRSGRLIADSDLIVVVGLRS